MDRLLLVGHRLAPGMLDALKIITPATLLRWHRAGLRAYWRWKSRPLGGRPSTPADIRRLIREMSIANSLWGAPRIHEELLKLGIDVGLQRGAATKAEGEDRNNGGENCHHDRDGTTGPRKSPAFLSLVEI